MLKSVYIFFLKDISYALKDGGRLIALCCYAWIYLLLMALMMEGSPKLLHQMAGGSLWMAVLLASSISLEHGFAADLKHQAIEALVIWPADKAAFFYGKALANMLFLIIAYCMLLPFLVLFFRTDVFAHIWELLPFLLLGNAAIAAPGTFYALMTKMQQASILLPLLLFPLLVPVMLAATKGTNLVLLGDPMGEKDTWLQLLVIFNAVHWSLSGLLFSRLIED